MIYINTNKTADINKNEQEKGYILEWHHEEALYWLEKLRNWQEKYNAILKPTPWSSLKSTDFRHERPHDAILEERGECCFLFRNPAVRRSRGKHYPIDYGAIDRCWRSLLVELEKILEASGETLPGGNKIRFLSNGKPRNAYYTLHSLRVSLVTLYVLEGNVPLPVMMKVVGHSRLLMTLYYTKLSPPATDKYLNNAEKLLKEEAEKEGNIAWLIEQRYEQAKDKFVYNDPIAIQVGTNPSFGPSLVLLDYGICPMGGAGCDKGGLLQDNETEKNRSVPVPGYPEEKNCILCRFFLTGPAFLRKLTTYGNFVSLKFSDCMERYLKTKKRVDELDKIKYSCCQNGKPFTQTFELSEANRLQQENYESCMLLGLKFSTVYKLLTRSKDLLNSDPSSIHLVHVGSARDVQIALEETTSRLRQQQAILENAHYYSGLNVNELIYQRSQVIDTILRKNGIKPFLFERSVEEQRLIGNHIMKFIELGVDGNWDHVDAISEGKLKLNEIGIKEKATRFVEKLHNSKLIDNLEHFDSQNKLHLDA